MREMRREDRSIPDEQAREILKKGEYGVLSLYGEAEGPYGIPLSYAFREEGIYFHCALEGKKLELIHKDNRVSFCVVGKTELLASQFTTRYESVIGFGRARELEGEAKRSGLIILLEKYSPDYMESGMSYIEKLFERTGMFCIDLERISGKARR